MRPCRVIFCIRMSSEYKFTMTLVTYKRDGADRCVDKTVGGCVYVSAVSWFLFFDIYIYIFIYLQEKMTVLHDGRVGRVYGAINPVPQGHFLPLMGRGPIGHLDGPSTVTSSPTSASLPRPFFGRGRASRFLPLIPPLHSSTLSSTPPPPGALIGGGGILKPHPYPPLIPSIDSRLTSSAISPISPLFIPTYTLCRIFTCTYMYRGRHCRPLVHR